MLIKQMIVNFKDDLKNYSYKELRSIRESDTDKKRWSTIVSAALDCIELVEGRESGLENNELAELMFREIYINANQTQDMDKKLGYVLGFLDIYIKELFVCFGPFDEDIIQAEEILIECSKSENVSKSRSFHIFNDLRVQYHQRFRMAIIKERLSEEFNSDIEDVFFKKLNDIESKSIDINRRLESSAKDLESLQNNIASSVVLKDFKSFSEKVDRKLASLNKASERLKTAMYIIPIASMLLGAILIPPWQFYSSLAVLMLVLGVILRNNLRSIDQFEQISSKIDNKIAMAKFHRNQIEGLSQEEKQAANAEFMRMVYSPIETKEWNVPDLSEHIINAIRRIK